MKPFCICQESKNKILENNMVSLNIPMIVHKVSLQVPEFNGTALASLMATIWECPECHQHPIAIIPPHPDILKIAFSSHSVQINEEKFMSFEMFVRALVWLNYYSYAGNEKQIELLNATQQSKFDLEFFITK